MYLTQQQAAEKLGCSIKQLQLLRRAKELKAIKWGHRSIRYAEEELKRYLDKKHEN